ncbi:hypothetical protein FOA52_010379 [Chlamydomonas sp. UWO 241]|nr:hypothetical protein FOA52_010379 [Chlamydomonas sp. UWO 241]
MSVNKCAYSLHGAGASCSSQFAGAQRPPHLNGKSNMAVNKCAYSLHGAGASCSP